jgi:hypothetical protein
MSNKLLKDSKFTANQPEVFVEMLDFVLNEDVKALEVGDYEFWSEFGVWCSRNALVFKGFHWDPKCTIQKEYWNFSLFLLHLPSTVH